MLSSEEETESVFSKSLAPEKLILLQWNPYIQKWHTLNLIEENKTCSLVRKEGVELNMIKTHFTTLSKDNGQ